MFYIVFVFDDASTEVAEVEKAPTSPWDYLTHESLKDSVMETLVFEGKQHKMVGKDW